MALQNTFTRAYVKKLKNEIENNLGKYASEKFEVDQSQILCIPNVEQPEGLLEKMMSSTNDAEAAIALYEAYEDLSPLQASLEAFWVYLAHTELFPYVQKRWNKVKEGGNLKNYVLDHWFFNYGIVRNALSGLWWGVHCTKDKFGKDPYKYTRFYFSNYTLRVVRLGPTKLFRHKEAVFGIINYLIDTRDAPSTNSMEDRVNFVVSHFNKMGATKQLVYLERKFFYNELDKVRDALLSFRHKKTSEEDSVEQEDL